MASTKPNRTTLASGKYHPSEWQVPGIKRVPSTTQRVAQVTTWVDPLLLSGWLLGGGDTVLLDGSCMDHGLLDGYWVDTVLLEGSSGWSQAAGQVILLHGCTR
jgi:hypothetical protein